MDRDLIQQLTNPRVRPWPVNRLAHAIERAVEDEWESEAYLPLILLNPSMLDRCIQDSVTLAPPHKASPAPRAWLSATCPIWWQPPSHGVDLLVIFMHSPTIVCSTPMR